MGELSDSESGPERPRPKAANEGQASDQAPGEEVVQVNDQYTGGEEAPADEPSRDDEQHPTGG